MVTPNTSTVKRQKESVNTRACAREAARMLEEEFEDWYQHYPKKVSRGPAEEAFEKALASGASLEELIAGAKRYAVEAASRGTRASSSIRRRGSTRSAGSTSTRRPARDPMAS